MKEMFSMSEQIVVDNYATEMNKTSKKIYKKMNAQARKSNLISGLSGGVIMGLIVGALFSPRFAHAPVHDSKGRITEYKLDKEKLSRLMLYVLSLCTLITLGVAGAQTLADKEANRKTSTKLTQDALENCFKQSMAKAFPNEKTYDLKSYMVASGLIMTSMSQQDLVTMRNQMSRGLKQDRMGEHYISHTAITEAMEIINKHMQNNPELNRGVFKILKGERPDSYILPLFLQKTK